MVSNNEWQNVIMLESKNPKTTTNLPIGYHNIEGNTASYMVQDIQSLNLINDIEILAETWAEFKNYDPQKTKGCKKGRKSGSGDPTLLQILLKPFIKILKSSPTHIWFEIDKNLFYNIPKRVRACTLYSPPETSKYYPENLWDDLKHKYWI